MSLETSKENEQTTFKEYFDKMKKLEEIEKIKGIKDATIYDEYIKNYDELIKNLQFEKSKILIKNFYKEKSRLYYNKFISLLDNTPIITPEKKEIILTRFLSIIQEYSKNVKEYYFLIKYVIYRNIYLRFAAGIDKQLIHLNTVDRTNKFAEYALDIEFRNYQIKYMREQQRITTEIERLEEQIADMRQQNLIQTRKINEIKQKQTKQLEQQFLPYKQQDKQLEDKIIEYNEQYPFLHLEVLLKDKFYNPQITETITVLNLSGQLLNYSDDEKKKIMKLLCYALINNNTVFTLDLSNNDLTKDLLYYLKRVLIYNQTINTLILSKNYLNDNDLEDFYKGLKYNKSIEILDLSYNRLNNLINLNEVLKVNSTLSVLSLSFNHINGVSLIHLRDGLIINNKLYDLDLSHNAAIYGLPREFCEGLMYNKSLTNLNLSYTQLSNINHLGDVLKVNNSLVNLSLKSDVYLNKYDNFFLGLKYNSSLNYIDITGIRNEDFKNKLIEVLDYNTNIVEVKTK